MSTIDPGITGRSTDIDAGPLLPMRDVCARYRVTDRTVERWLDDEALGFPAPIYINRRRYFRERELIEFERRRVAASADQHSSNN
jgi:hypothetical protein